MTGGSSDSQQHTMQPLWPEVSWHAIKSLKSLTALYTAEHPEHSKEYQLSGPEYIALPVQGESELYLTSRSQTEAVSVEEGTKESVANLAAFHLLNSTSKLFHK